ncbi:hypothetical protein LR48_Vigan07g259500 [Vigna angularis]|uniref:Uncharacterized protein n=2 Tax=Phaseolus angularis TaxID=3914 RepID=A0A0L9V1Q6_PHAAN|nr:uncharacterized protein LOC108337578 [Vigna angularis]KAG2390251.1 uncharacterized protein HKW66_Vig0223430 [Vigna angularis]KOM48891.1 hypothetical protein LR48_Vigan07g259500 [Vigna angularis]BAT82533.1 hypothetical protein VIGAN_03256400 [Vigna angularis var. angularis]
MLLHPSTATPQPPSKQPPREGPLSGPTLRCRRHPGRRWSLASDPPPLPLASRTAAQGRVFLRHTRTNTSSNRHREPPSMASPVRTHATGVVVRANAPGRLLLLSKTATPRKGFPPPSSPIPSSPTTPIIIILNHRTLLSAFNIHPLPGNSASDNREPHQTYKKQPKPFPNYHRLLRALRIFPKPPNHRLLPLRVSVIYFVFVWLGMGCGDSRECEYGYGDGGNEGGGDESVKMKPLFGYFFFLLYDFLGYSKAMFMVLEWWSRWR